MLGKRYPNASHFSRACGSVMQVQETEGIIATRCSGEVSGLGLICLRLIPSTYFVKY